MQAQTEISSATHKKIEIGETLEAKVKMANAKKRDLTWSQVSGMRLVKVLGCGGSLCCC